MAPPRSLTSEVMERIAADITQGKLAAGSRLPTEQEMMAAMGVSRTVVREAVAALRAEGLVTTRQGLGAFVAEDALKRPFRIEPDGLRSIAKVLEVMELRLGIEVEAAGLAAERAEAASLDAIGAALTAIEAAIARDELGIAEDFAFHHAIAQATENPQFPRFLEYLGRFIIPRQSVRVSTPRPRAYLERVQKEHRAIFEAIRRHSVAGARQAMRLHLSRSQERYSKLAAQAGATPTAR
jgi:GntR family transcriptional regulator, transcriptional repressor for pyruvate dehydrogenase complex